ncbi:MAG: ABC transporter substrate-binding protein [Deltaproteobacteria bacterium]|nr:MAG: ABC transporter substrate-binding protein [Deltaproteobacteria bacterium]
MRTRARVGLLALSLVTSIGPSPRSHAESGDVARRVVSMNPSLTAIALALDARTSLVGVDEYSARQQASVRGLPTVGGLFNPSLEAVVALEPDLVVVVPSLEQRNFRERLEALGIPVLELPNTDFEAVLRSIEQLGARLGRPEAAQRRVAEIRRTRARVANAIRDLPRPRTVLVLQRDPLYVVGPGSFVDEMLDAAGADNVAGHFDTAYPRVSLEWLLAAAPEVIVDASADPEPARDYWARWPSIPAVREGRVVAVSQDVVTLPGPYLDRALRTLARTLHGAEWSAPLDAAP